MTDIQTDNFEKSHSIIKDAMKNVIQEIVIKLEDGSSHLVYITGLNIEDGKVSIDWSTPSEDMKEVIGPHVEECIKKQINTQFDTMLEQARKRIFSF